MVDLLPAILDFERKSLIGSIHSYVNYFRDSIENGRAEFYRPVTEETFKDAFDEIEKRKRQFNEAIVSYSRDGTLQIIASVGDGVRMREHPDYKSMYDFIVWAESEINRIHKIWR